MTNDEIIASMAAEYAKDAEGAPDIPEKIFRDIENRFEKYLLFETVKKDVREYTCTGCHETFKNGPKVINRIMTSADYDLWHARHNSSAVCPLCGCTAAVINIKLSAGWRKDQAQYIAILDVVAPDDVWIRCIGARRSYCFDKDFRNIKGCTQTREWNRYHLRPGKAEFWRRDYSNEPLIQRKLYSEPFAWNCGLFNRKFDYITVTASDIGIKGTFLRYNGFKSSGFYGDSPYIRYLCHYAEHPQLEMLSKLGHNDVVYDVVMKNYEGKANLDWNADKPWELFRLSRQDYNLWRKKYFGDYELYKVYKRMHGAGARDFEIADSLYSMARRRASDAYKIIAAARKMKCGIRDVVKYIEKVQRSSGGGCCHCPGITLQEACYKWLDYTDMARKAGLLKTASAMPKDLSEAHDRMLAAVNHQKYLDEKKDREKKIKEELKWIEQVRKNAASEGAEIEKRFKKVRSIYAGIAEKYAYGNNKYTVVVPSGAADIIVEGSILHHCISSVDRYYERIERNESYLMFLRKTSDIDTPYYTLEVEPGGAVRQKRTYFDRQNEDIKEAVEFLREWQGVIQKRLTKSDKKKAEKSRKLRNDGFAELRKNKTVIRNGYLRGKYLADVLEADLLDITYGDAEKTEKKNKREAV